MFLPLTECQSHLKPKPNSKVSKPYRQEHLCIDQLSVIQVIMCQCKILHKRSEFDIQVVQEVF